MNTRPSAVDRRGGTNPVLHLLLAGVFLALIVLIWVLLTRGPGGDEALRPLPPPKAVGDPTRVKEVLRPGKTYEVVVKAGFDARVEDRDWALKQVMNVHYVAEFLIARTVESNDGQRIVEVRHFEKARNVKILCEYEGISVDLGEPGQLLLTVLDLQTGGQIKQVIQEVVPVVSAISKPFMENLVTNDKAKVFSWVDSLQGKRVRITYMDGVGVQSVEPLGCELTPAEEDFLRTTAVLADCYILLDVKSTPGSKWKVDGRQIAGLIDPSLRAVPQGEINVARESDVTEGGKQFAQLKIEGGVLELDSSDSSRRRVGTFAPRGVLRYNVTDGFMEKADFQGRINIEQVSKDHLLFESSFRTQPILQGSYSCKMR